MNFSPKPSVACPSPEKQEEPSEQYTPLNSEQKLAMNCLPMDGRWQTEAQLIGQTQLGTRAGSVYRDLVKAGFCEYKVVPVLHGLLPLNVFMQMYRATWTLRQAFWKSHKAALMDCVTV